MFRHVRDGLLCVALLLIVTVHAGAQPLSQAQTQAAAQVQAAPSVTSGADSGWNVAIYPVLVWVPLGIDINVSVPPIDGGGGGGGADHRRPLRRRLPRGHLRVEGAMESRCRRAVGGRRR